MAPDRDALLAQLAEWLDDALADEEPPPGLDAVLLDDEATPPPDEAAKWSVLAALTQEVRLQGRSFKQLSDGLTPLQERVAAVLQRHEELLETRRHEQAELAERRRQEEAAAERRGRAAVLEVLLDVRDRLVRGLQTSRPPAGWLARFTASRNEALEDGYRLGLARLDGALEEMQVTPIAAGGQPFDARSMQAVAVEDTDAVARGTVLEVIREGYRWRGEVFRAAQVKVARPTTREEAK